MRCAAQAHCCAGPPLLRWYHAITRPLRRKRVGARAQRARCALCAAPSRQAHLRAAPATRGSGRPCRTRLRMQQRAFAHMGVRGRAGSARGHVCECAWARACVLGACPSAHPTVACRGEGKGCRGELCGPCAVSPSTNRCHAHSGVRARQRPRRQRAEPMAAAASRARRRSGSGGGRRRERWRPAQGRISCSHRDAGWSRGGA